MSLKLLVLPLAAALLASACGVDWVAAPPEPTPTAAPATPVPLPEGAANRVDDYIARASSFLQELDDGADHAVLATRAQEMLDLSLKLLPDYLVARPACEAYLTAAVEIAVIWDSLTIEAIERDYHRDGVLPTSKAPRPAIT